MPSVRRFLTHGLVLAIIWGFYFGWLDGVTWTVRNWVEAVAVATVSMLGVWALMRFQLRRNTRAQP
jgi:uncharacterized membrane protein